MKKSRRPSVYVVIPVFNRVEYTRACLESLAKQIIPPTQTVVVDDGSTDGTFEMIARSFPDVMVLHGTGKLFWTASINLGIRYALDAGRIIS